MNICAKPHRYADILNHLPDSQSSNEGRHLCAGCAYEMGYTDGLNNEKRELSKLNLPYSQAGTGRHKSAHAAYELGWKEGNQKYRG